MRGIFVASSGNDITFLNILNNTVDTPHNCLEFKPFDNSVLTSLISGNDFISRGPGIRRATFVDAHNSGKQITTISYNSFSVPNAGTFDSALLLEGQNPSASFDATIIGNIFHDSPRGCRINVKQGGANNFTVNVLANRFQNNTTNDFLASMGSTADNSKYLCLALNGNIAPDLGFALTNDNTAPLTVYNVRSALFNIGDIVESGAGTITHNPICPPSPLP
jgi:hypothetical protein